MEYNTMVANQRNAEAALEKQKDKKRRELARKPREANASLLHLYRVKCGGSAGGNPSAQTLNWFACGCIISHKNGNCNKLFSKKRELEK